MCDAACELPDRLQPLRMAQLLFEGFALGDVEEKADAADDLAFLVLQRCRRDDDLDGRAVLSRPFGLPVDRFAGEETFEGTGCLLAREEGRRFVDHLVGTPAEELLGARIPERDLALAPDGDDRKRRRIDQRLELFESLGELVFVALLGVHDQADPQEDGDDSE